MFVGALGLESIPFNGDEFCCQVESYAVVKCFVTKGTIWKAGHATV